MNATNTFASWLYPGGWIWAKRVRHIFVLSLIGTNLFINNLQEQLLVTATELINWTTPLADSAVSVATYVEEKELPVLKALEDSEFSWIGEWFGLPKVSTVESGINSLKNSQKRLSEIGTGLQILSAVLFWTSIVLLISIAYSVFWLISDLYLGKARVLVGIMIIIATVFNVCSYYSLNEFISFLTV